MEERSPLRSTRKRKIYTRSLARTHARTLKCARVEHLRRQLDQSKKNERKNKRLDACVCIRGFMIQNLASTTNNRSRSFQRDEGIDGREREWERDWVSVCEKSNRSNFQSESDTEHYSVCASCKCIIAHTHANTARQGEITLVILMCAFWCFPFFFCVRMEHSQ